MHLLTGGRVRCRVGQHGLERPGVGGGAWAGGEPDLLAVDGICIVTPVDTKSKEEVKEKGRQRIEME